MLKLLSVLVLVLTIGVGQMWGSTYTWTMASGDLGTSESPATSATKGSPSAAWSIDWTWHDSSLKYLGFESSGSTRGIQIGKGTTDYGGTTIVLSTSGISGTISAVSVNAAIASSGGATLSVKVGSTAFKCNNNTTVSPTTAANDYSFTGSASGDIEITLVNTKTNKGMYIKSISVTYTSTPATITLSKAGSESAVGGTHYVGDSYTLPEDVTETCGDKSFVGWSSVPITTPSPAKPTASTYHEPEGQVTLAATNTFYAVYAEASSGGGSSNGSNTLVSSSSSTYYSNGYITGVSGTDKATWTTDAFSMVQYKNNGNAVPLNYAEIRAYQYHSLEFSPSSGTTITSIVINANSNSYASAVGGSSISNCTKSVSGSTVTITPTDGTAAITLVQGAQSRINSIVVNYTTGGGTTYSNYTTQCCTSLGQINGSVSEIHPTSAVVKLAEAYSDAENATAYQLKVVGSSNYNDWTDVNKANLTTSDGVTVNGLTCGTNYTAYLHAKGSSSYCEFGEESSVNFTTSKYVVNLTNSGTADHGTFSANPATACSDDQITLSSNPEDGYHIDSWTVTKESSGTIEVVGGKFTMPAENVTVSATFESDATPLNINFTAESHATLSATVGGQAATEAYAGDNVTLSCTDVTTGYQFFGWTVVDGSSNPVSVTNNTFEMPSSAVTVTADIRQMVTVTFHNGSADAYDTKQTYVGGTITLASTPTKFDDNFPNFVGWAASNTGMVTSIPTLMDGTETISADADYYSVFSDAPVATNNYKKITESAELTNGKYLIVANYNNALHALENGTVSNKSYYLSDGVVVPSENVVTNPSAAKIWTIGDGRTLYNADAEKYLKVLYADNQFNNIGLDDNSMNLTIAEGSADDAWIIYGVDGRHNIYLSHSTNSWDEFLASVNPYDLYLYKQQFASTKWTTRQVVYVTISYDANGATDYEGDLPANAQIESGTDYTVSTATLSREGYNFIGWNTDDEATVGLNSLTNVTSNTTLHAVWEEIPTYDVKFSVNGSVADGLTLNLQEGASITFPKATVPEGSDKKFVGWIEASSYASDDAPTFVTSATIGNADKTYYAVFADEASSNYTKVTSEPEDWSGEYILAYDNSATEAFVFDGTDKASDYVTAEVSEVNSKSVIASLPTGGATITIAKIPETTNYSIMVNGGDNNGKYLKGGSSTNNTMSFEENAIANGISWGTNGIVFEYNSSYMRFNTTANQTRFRYYKSSTYTTSGYEAISLYKHAATYTAYVTTVAALDHIAITTAPKAAYKKGEALNLSGMVVTAYFGTGEGQTSKVVTNYTASPANGATLATTDESVTISYLGEEASQTIHVYALSGIALSGTHKTTYKSGETVDATNLVVTATWGGNAADKIVEAVTGYTIDLEEALTTANNKYTVTYTHEEVAQTADQAIHVYDLSGIAVTTHPTKTKYNAGESFDATDMVVTATWGGNATDKIVEAVTGYATDPATLSNDTENDAVVDVTISYTANGVNKTTTQQVTVHPLPNLTMTWDVAGTTTTSKIYINAQDKYLLVLPENDPDVPAGFGAGYVFKGWTNAASVAKDGSDFVKATAGTEMTEATTFHAVFALKNGEDAPAGYRLVNAAPEAGETVILSRKVNDTYYAFTNSAGSSEMTLTNGIVSSSTSSILWDAKAQCGTIDATGVFLFVNNGTNLIHVNSTSFNITTGKENGDIVFTANGDGSFTAARAANDRWFSASGTNGFGVTSNSSSAVALYIFKYAAETTATYSNFRFAPSNVVAPEITLAEGTYYGVQSTTITQSQSKPIYYTLDGTNPTNASTLYEGAISLNEAGTKTIKAVAYDEATDDYSAFDEATYTIVTSIAAPTIPASGKFYTESKEVEISHELTSEGVEILYSFDGVNYSTYSSALNITETKTVYAKATIGSLTSEVVSATYTKGVVVNYSKLTSTSQLAAGMEFILVSVGSEQYVTAGELNDAHLDTLRIAAPVENVLAITRDVKVFTLDGQPAAWTMTSEDGMLFSNGDKKVNYSDNGDGTWNLTFSNNTLTIANNGTGNGNLRYNASAPRFTTYSGQTTVDIYYKEYATAYTLTYDVDGTENDKTVKVVEGYEYTIVNNVFGDAPEGGIDAYWKDANNNLYTVGDKIILTSNMTLTPVWSQVVRSSLAEGKMGTICPKQEVKYPTGASFYELTYKTIENGVPYKVFFDEIAEGASLVAGKPYLFVADGESFTGVKVGDEATEGVNDYNGFHGILNPAHTTLSVTADDAANYKYYIITNNEIRLCGAGTFTIPVERAYIDMSALSEEQVAQSPGRRRVCLTNRAAETVTGVDELNASEAPVKVMIDGLLFIIRGEKMYNANGQVVK